MDYSNFFTNERINTGVDLMLHGVILFLFLTVFFLLYVSKLSRKTINNELENMIKSGVNNAFESLPKDQNDKLKAEIKTFPFDVLKKNYTGLDGYEVINNSWLTELLIVTNIFLFVIFNFMVFILKNVCNIDIHMTEIIKINVLTFLLIGGVEFAFFKFVASDYAPTSPSLMITSIMNDIKNYLT